MALRRSGVRSPSAPPRESGNPTRFGGFAPSHDISVPQSVPRFGCALATLDELKRHVLIPAFHWRRAFKLITQTGGRCSGIPQRAGLWITPPGVGTASGNCELASRWIRGSILKSASHFSSTLPLARGGTRPIVIPQSTLAIRIGVSRSESFETMTAQAQAPRYASRSRCAARFTCSSRTSEASA